MSGGIERRQLHRLWADIPSSGDEDPDTVSPESSFFVRRNHGRFSPIRRATISCTNDGNLNCEPRRSEGVWQVVGNVPRMSIPRYRLCERWALRPADRGACDGVDCLDRIGAGRERLKNTYETCLAT